ncbi:hypothetical protein FEM48_Zijuj09G0072600 [Ziziphus jujuba var. spinosa]|uniref:Thioredoxin-like protein 4B n=1 Tax=Ziziphus jujuba var. spinosa TaxID=714518 RepID=A0A978URL1_ZIZJJ|nr:hypothetical protein FEM48_Zijuj09G0072600 [Ziziphus jujuba var. spinosa]
MSYVLNTLTKKREVDSIISDTIDKVLVLRFGRASDSVCLLLDDVVRPPLLPSLPRLSKSAREVSNFTTVVLVGIDSEDVQVYINYFDITLIPSTIFFFNAHHMKMDSGYYFFFLLLFFYSAIWTADHTKWVGAFHQKQDFIDVVEAIFGGAMKGKLIVNCPLPPERIPKYQLLYKDVEEESPLASASDICCLSKHVSRLLTVNSELGLEFVLAIAKKWSVAYDKPGDAGQALVKVKVRA